MELPIQSFFSFKKTENESHFSLFHLCKLVICVSICCLCYLLLQQQGASQISSHDLGAEYRIQCLYDQKIMRFSRLLSRSFRMANSGNQTSFGFLERIFIAFRIMQQFPKPAKTIFQINIYLT